MRKLATCLCLVLYLVDLNGQFMNALRIEPVDALSMDWGSLGMRTTEKKDLTNSKAVPVPKIPMDLWIEKEEVLATLSKVEQQQQYLLSKGMNIPDTTQLTISSQLLELHQRYCSIKTYIERNYPDCYPLNYDLYPISVKEIQNNLLEPQQTLLEYYIGGTKIFVFIYNKEEYRAFEIENDFPLEEWVAQIHNTNQTEQPDYLAETYTAAAHQLYKKLIAPIAKYLQDELIIIPDGILGYLPFEALLVKKPLTSIRWKKHRYLLQEKQISYCYSPSLLNEMKYKPHKNDLSKGLLAMAPFYNSASAEQVNRLRFSTNAKESSPSSLFDSGEEVYCISNLTNGTALYNEEATKEQFIRLAPRYRFLHLATHGRVNPETGKNSFLMFTKNSTIKEDELLYLRDLNNLQLNADMVVLSACETATGEFQRGGKRMGLTRGFIYAGAKSIVTTLWATEDTATKELMILFYEYLTGGMTKDAALRQAKLDYIHSVKDEDMAHPFYWSGFVGVGDMGAVW